MEENNIKLKNMAFTADDVLFGYTFNKLAFNVPTPYLINETEDKIPEFTNITRGEEVGNTSVFRVDGHGLEVGNRFRIIDVNGEVNYAEIISVTADTFTAELFETPEFTVDLTGLNISLFGRYFPANASFAGFKTHPSGIWFRIFSNTNQILSVSWGDGTFENLILTPNINFQRMQHEYTDGLDFHTIEFTFEKPSSITLISSNNVTLGNIVPDDIKKFTNLETLYFGARSGISQFPLDLSSLPLLSDLGVVQGDLPKIDSSIYSLPIKKLNFERSLDFSEPLALESLQNIPQLVFLENLILTDTNLLEFPPDFVNRTELTQLVIGGANPFTTLPFNIPTSVKILSLDRKAPRLTSYQNFDRLINLEGLIINAVFDQVNLPIGTELLSCTKLKNVRHTRNNFQPLAQTNAIIDNWYNFITANATMDNSSNVFRNMEIKVEGLVSTNMPTGIYQQPINYIEGVDNGLPDNPMEKMYVLVNTYKHTWFLNTQIFQPIN